MKHCAKVLPAQGPIGIFVHHNTLHAYEPLPFEQGVEEAARRYGAEPYWSLAGYRAALAQGRIAERDLEVELRRELGDAADEPLAFGVSRLELARLLAVEVEREPSLATFEWMLTEGRAEPLLWQAALGAARRTPPSSTADVQLARGAGTLAQVHPVLIRLCAAFLDQGVAYWTLPALDAGFFAATARLLSLPFGPPIEWLRAAGQSFLELAQLDSGDVVLTCLDELGVHEPDWVDYVSERLLALPGWAGMFHQLEQRPDRAPVHAPPATLMDFLAVRLVLERALLRAGADGSSASPSPAAPPEPAFTLYALARAAGVTASRLAALDDDGCVRLGRFITRFDEVVARRVFQRAYERRYRIEVLDALAAHPPFAPPPPRFQLVFCIDEREESIRRHLEEVAPDCETFGTPGYFGVAMYYKGIDDAHPRPLCPIAITPAHEVDERPRAGRAKRLERRVAQRHALGVVAAGAHVGSRTFLRGTVWTTFMGLYSAVPLVTRVLFPRATAALRSHVSALSMPRVETELALERREHDAPRHGHWCGFTVAEMTDIVESELVNIGLVRDFTRLVAFVGHGSHSLNNPHESAHDCGACGGGHGAANARALAQMANHPAVRARLAERGIAIEPSTHFLGAFHDSCDDAIEFFDLPDVPDSLGTEVTLLASRLDRARGMNALERCRRFDVPHHRLGPESALRHVEARAEDLAQPRPEYGHATNAVCVIGRRARTRGLFLDRRAFLMSYDPTTDQDGAILTRVLASVVPVGAGINLEYYFSFVDQKHYGSGTKLPHNITGLVGVMDGHASDLRTGLPWQMVEIHEPVRLLAVIEADPDRVLAAAQATPSVWRLVKNQWLQVATLAPDSSAIHLLDDGRFVPYVPERDELGVQASSLAIFSNHRGPIAPVRVVAGPP
ncbi:MAG: DUF2309 domain-containing protein [Polyangiaceae bacterium]|nr:DUF2309 domain-containing protein [Polyangiaceae bacterium]